MNKISILGCGWLGKKLGKFLVQNQYLVLGSQTTQNGFADLLKRGIQPYVVNIASDPFQNTDNLEFFDTNLLIIGLKPQRKINDDGEFVNRNKAIISLVVKHQIKQVILLSSTSVYNDNCIIVNETSVTEPKKAGGQNLVLVEQLWQNVPQINLTILRLAGLVGYNRNPITTLSLGKATEALFAPVNLVHADDVANIVLQLIQTQRLGGTFNIVADAHPLRFDYYKPAYAMLNLTIPEVNVPNPVSFKVVDNAKIKLALKYRFIMSNPLEMWDWQHQNFQTLNLD